MKKHICLIFSIFILISCNTSIENITKPKNANNTGDVLNKTHSHYDVPLFPEIKNKNTVVKIENLSTNSSNENNDFFEIKLKGYDKNQSKNDNKPEKRDIQIDDVILVEAKSSILNNSEGEGISANYNGKLVTLKIMGNFNTTPNTKIETMKFKYEDGLLHQSFIGEAPRVRIMLDDNILLTPVSASENEVIVNIDTKGIPDFYLMGLHKLTFIGGNYFTDVLVNVKVPEEDANLSPVIENIEVLRDEDNSPINIKVTGKNFMVNPKFSYAQIDGEFGFGHQTNVLIDNIWETVIHIPNPETFDNASEHNLMYATPFGVQFKSF